MTVLITGAGLIGRLTAARLHAQHESVVLADVRMPEESTRRNLHVVQCDVTDFDALSTLIDRHRVRAVVHTAALLSTAIRRDPLAGIKVNMLGTANVLEAARRHRLDRIVIASSTTVAYTAFGTLPAEPIAEDFVSHSVSEAPASLYAATKVAGEHLALAYASLYGLSTVVLRYGAVLGTGPEAATSVPGRLLHCLLDAGRRGVPAELDDPVLLWNGREEFVDARDCADANVAALRAAAPTQRTYNIATGAWWTVDEFVDVVRAQFPALRVGAMRLPDGGFAGFPHRRPAPSDVRAARRELGFTAACSLADSVAHFARDAGR
ncbi:NAD-dependent epimerase/dehydratase family protein [Burkholderia ubonensis]|uniref:UDP-glucose 4-epimerase n=1 Tax=Burkholderia ubonensis TaxID=101571 RepID=A0ABD6PTX8_9BURK|nr:NAD(P)-dependent oxidoreductase [Burkholderia ubonensis]KVM61976.1 UDP-glucose 4-epimerase [Burkholderia ubonensis]KVT49991.1 UDP-glucose 4-epimerase [Burkholderia ubonensis]KVX83068.1 UDP-glucose 4-epimerase [Burkholderia ubonensis]KWF01847.1 UDP-glucose 4-epimerase [Burkholderia ubonensis]OJA35838.1 UDP-glucose 4-epimerase [Burkholderia ubonensis]